MNHRAGWLLPGLLLLVACASSPPQPASLARYERDMQRATERFQDGRLREASDRYRLAANQALQIDDPARIAMAELGLGAVSIELGELDRAMSHYRTAAAEGLRSDRDDLAAQATLGIAEVARREGDCTSALAGTAALRESTDRALRLTAELLEAHCLRASGDSLGAARLLEAVGTEIESAPAGLRSAWHATRAAGHLANGDPDAALEDAGKALAINRARRYPPAIAADHRLLAEIHAAAGRETEAAFHRQRAGQIAALIGLQGVRATERN